MYKIAVTGATGFVGNFVSDYLESKGYKVFRFGRKNKKGIINWDIAKGVYDNALEVDCVVHCAASVDDWASYKQSYDANVLGTANVIKSFPDASKFIYISSASVYNAFCERLVISENECIGGKLLNSYSKTKFLGEKEVEKSSIPSKIILRPHIIYGLGDVNIGPRIRSGVKFGYLFLPGNGKNRISFTNIENLAQSILQAINVSKEGVYVYNITDKESITLIEAIKCVKKLNNLEFKEFFIPRRISLIIGSILEFSYRLLGIKKPPLLTRYVVDQISSDHIFSIVRAQNELGYNPIKDIGNDFLI